MENSKYVDVNLLIKNPGSDDGKTVKDSYNEAAVAGGCWLPLPVVQLTLPHWTDSNTPFCCPVVPLPHACG